MPLAIPKRCGFRGCPKTTRGRYCDEHAPLAGQFYDRRRGTTKERGYDRDWERVAEQRRKLDCGLCQRCLHRELVVPSQIVDHIIPIHVRPDWRLEIGNTQVLCFDCHTTKTSEDTRRFGGRAQRMLTTEQTRNRCEAQQLMHAPRDNEVRDE